MSSTYLGGVTVSALAPGAAALHAQLVGKLQAELAASLAACANIQANLGVNLTANLQAAIEAIVSGKLLASLQGTIALDVNASLQASLTANLALVASLRVAIDALLALGLGTAGLHAWKLENRADSVASDASAALASIPGAQPGDLARALVIATTDPVAWEALGKLLLTG